MKEQPNPVVIYDGQCKFCNAIVNLVLKKDKKQIFRFSPVQSKEARAILREFNESFISLQTIYVVDRKNVMKRSKACFFILSKLGFPYSAMSLFRFLPLFITDYVYKVIAKNRYKWFGMSDTVIEPDEKMKSRFL